MDPFGEISCKCCISASQEEILTNLLLSHESQETLAIFSTGEPINPPPSPPIGITICSLPDSTSPTQKSPSPRVRRISPTNTKTLDKSNPLDNSANNAQKSKPSKIISPMAEKDSCIWETTTKRCSNATGKSDAKSKRKGKGKGKSKSKLKRDSSGEFENPQKSIAVASSPFNDVISDDVSGVSVARVFERLIRNVSEEGNGNKSAYSKDQGLESFCCNADRDVLNKSPKSNVGVTKIASENVGELRKMPSSIRRAVEEEAVISSGFTGEKRLENSILAKLFDVVNALRKESDVSIGRVDVLEVAEEAGYTFPRPRWWPPEDEF